jgi:hypothetical protein
MNDQTEVHKLLNRTGAARRTFANRSTKVQTISELNAILIKRVNAYSIVCIIQSKKASTKYLLD